MHDIAAQSIKGEKYLADTLVRLGQKYSMFGHRVIDEDDVVPTILSGHRDIWLRNGNGMSKGDMISSQTFPQDYNFGSDSYGTVAYICGMSVPPIMIKRIVLRLIESGVFK
jgi:DNA (cytosine-5)-methyltransferase 1